MDDKGLARMRKKVRSVRDQATDLSIENITLRAQLTREVQMRNVAAQELIRVRSDAGALRRQVWIQWITLGLLGAAVVWKSGQLYGWW